MSVSLTVNGTTFEYPTSGQEPGWGGAATAWAEEVTEVLADLQGTNDILETTFNIANNQTTAANVVGLVFNTGTVRGAEIQYTLYRVTDSATSGNTETGKLNVVYDNSASAGSKWIVTNFGISGNAGVIFTMSDAGQIQYTSTNISGANYTGTMKFRAKTLLQ